MAALAILAFALGIGLTTTMFSIVNGAIIRGLPFPDSERIHHVAPFNTAERRDTSSGLHTVAERQWHTIVGVVPDLGMWDRRRNQEAFMSP